MSIWFRQTYVAAHGLDLALSVGGVFSSKLNVGKFPAERRYSYLCSVSLRLVGSCMRPPA